MEEINTTPQLDPNSAVGRIIMAAQHLRTAEVSPQVHVPEKTTIIDIMVGRVALPPITELQEG